MAVKTKCQTPGANFETSISENQIAVKVTSLPLGDMTEQEAELLEANIHNALELVLSVYFRGSIQKSKVEEPREKPKVNMERLKKHRDKYWDILHDDWNCLVDCITFLKENIETLPSEVLELVEEDLKDSLGKVERVAEIVGDTLSSLNGH